MGGLTPMPVMSAVKGFPEDFNRKGQDTRKNKFLADAAE
jgi:formate dehydrogenase iron-sulfur subunit